MKHEFYVLIWDFNQQKVKPYNIIPYFQREWKDENKSKFNSFEDIKKFIDDKARYQFWARCEYEFIVEGWPTSRNRIKLDIYDQIKMNLDLITTVFINSVSWKAK